LVAAGETLSVLSWNLWWRFGPWEERLPAIVETVRQLDPDVAGLQEVWVADGTSSAHHIAEVLGYHVAVEHRLDLDGVGFGNAVLSRWPITAAETVPLPAGDVDDEERFVLAADIDGPAARLQVFSTHLNWRHDHSHVRQQQVRVLCEAVAAKRPRPYPPVVCGDFNAEPDAEEMRMVTGKTSVPVPGLVLVDTWAAAGDGGRGHTWSNANPYAAEEFEHERRIDYVLAGWRRADGRGQAVSCRVVGDRAIDGVWPSDHFGVLAELRA
jgi:endonuclease/exonuclease/phosphatase family metal-dependent hydrolase